MVDTDYILVGMKIWLTISLMSNDVRFSHCVDMMTFCRCFGFVLHILQLNVVILCQNGVGMRCYEDI